VPDSKGFLASFDRASGVAQFGVDITKVVEAVAFALAVANLPGNREVLFTISERLVLNVNRICYPFCLTEESHPELVVASRKIILHSRKITPSALLLRCRQGAPEAGG
jgi:hypothetical protein